MLYAVLVFLAGASDVHRISDDIFFRTEVPTTLGAVVNSTCDQDLFAAGVVGMSGNLYIGLDIASSLKTERLVPMLGDKRTGTQEYWYGGFVGYTPGQLEFRFDRLWTFTTVLAFGAGVLTEVPLYMNTLESHDGSVDPVSYEYKAEAYTKRHGTYVVQFGAAATRRGLGVFGAYSTLRTFNIGLVFDVESF